MLRRTAVSFDLNRKPVMISIVESPNLANVSCRFGPMIRKSPVSYEIGGDLPGEGCRFAGALVVA